MNESKELNQDSIGWFVERSDELGGPSSPDCANFWANLQYVPTVSLEKQCEPLSRAYHEQQMALYREMTEHEYKESENEFTPGVAIDSLLNSPNAYGFMAPHEYARHCVAMGIVVQHLGLTLDQTVLELGSGWGFCQEFLAECGLRTKGIDVNPDFVCTSNRRLERLGFGARAELLPFGDIGPDLGLFDVVMAYEAFHHAVDPLGLLKRSVSCLRDNGRVVLAAEPFNNFYHTWGLRLDPYSVYCIRKFGWFESGWSSEYMAFIFAMGGLEAEYINMSLSDLTRYMIGSKTNRIRASQLGLWHPNVASSIVRDGDYFFVTDDTKFVIPYREGFAKAIVELENFARTPLALTIECLGKRQSAAFAPGKHSVAIDLSGATDESGAWVEVWCETFCPAEQGINDDGRQLGVHVKGLTYLLNSS